MGSSLGDNWNPTWNAALAKRVNYKQRRIALIGVGVILLILLFPPWSYFDDNTSNQASAGYHFFLNRPKVTTYEKMFGMPDDDHLTTRFVRVRFNFFRFITQLVFAVFLTIGLVLRLGGARAWSYRLFVTVASCAAVLFVLLLTVKF